MHSPARPLDVDDDGMMDHAVDDGGGDHGIVEVVAEFLKVNIRSCFMPKIAGNGRPFCK